MNTSKKQKNSSEPNYEIITVDWNNRQTSVWRHWVEKNCPGAAFYLIKDEKPIPWCWCGGKLNCFKHPFKTKKIIYMDTDTLVTYPLDMVFEIMEGEGLNVGASLFAQHLNKCQRTGNLYKNADKIEKRLGLKEGTFLHWNTGMVVLNDYDPMLLYENWKLAFALPEIDGHRWRQAEETAFSTAVLMDPEIRMWEIPFPIHGNIVGRMYQKGEVNLPAVLHYHQERRLTNPRLGHQFNDWLRVDP